MHWVETAHSDWFETNRSDLDHYPLTSRSRWHCAPFHSRSRSHCHSRLRSTYYLETGSPENSKVVVDRLGPEGTAKTEWADPFEAVTAPIPVVRVLVVAVPPFEAMYWSNWSGTPIAFGPGPGFGSLQSSQCLPDGFGSWFVVGIWASRPLRSSWWKMIHSLYSQHSWRWLHWWH